MTEKQEKILHAALELFAQEGFRVTPTSKIAKRAGVSEGLIFRHFTNKEGLLDAIMKEGEERAKLLFEDIVMESDPKTTIRKFAEIGYKLSENKSEANFWKLQYKLKWELEEYNAHKMEAVVLALTRAFEKLGYTQPQDEANQLIMLLDGMATQFFLNRDFDFKPQVKLMKSKYQL
jgi:AcrR family transcriptional regulator